MWPKESVVVFGNTVCMVLFSDVTGKKCVKDRYLH